MSALGLGCVETWAGGGIGRGVGPGRFFCGSFWVLEIYAADSGLWAGMCRLGR
jgi:hypothetical protein